MKAVILTENGPKYLEVQKPELEEGWSLLEVKAVGLCGSDMHKIKSPEEYLSNDSVANILGHEFSGLISQTKSADLVEGVGVTAIPIIQCDECPPCVEKDYGLCENIEAIGRTINGAFAEYVLVPDKNIRMIGGLGFDEAAMTDVYAVAVHTYHQAGCPIGEEVLVIGDGAIGLGTLQVFEAYGNSVSMVGKHDRSKLVSIGSYFNISSGEVNLGLSYDIVVETVGRDQLASLEMAIQAVKPKGYIFVSGVFDNHIYGKLPLRDLFYKEGSMQGINSYGMFGNMSEFDIALDLIKKDKVNPRDLITQKLALKDFNQGVDYMNDKSADAIKVIFNG